MNFNWVLDSTVARPPAVDADRVALSFDATVRSSYGELREQSLRYARGMRDLGLKKGDRLGMLLLNAPEYVPLYFAAMRLGVIAVRLNFRLAPDELAFLLEDSGCDVVIVHSSLVEKLEPVREQLDVRSYVVLSDDDAPRPSWALPLGVLEADDPLAVDEAPALGRDDPMVLLYTSGTTGLPKGAIWTHGNTLASGTMQALRWGFSERTVALVPGPIYHGGAFEAVVNATMLVHGTSVFLRSGGFTLERFLEVVREDRVTDALMFSFHLHDFLRREDLAGLVSPTLRRILVGGDTLMPWAAEAAERLLPGVELEQVFGVTDAGGISLTLQHDDIKAQPNSIGRPVPMSEVKVMSGDGREAGVDEVGEIWVRNEAVCDGYWNRPKANADTYVDGWAKTGDLGSVNAEGFLSLRGRAKDMIRSGGENIYPAEIEKVLSEHPGVEDSAVVGVPDERYHEVGCALIVPADGDFDPDALRAYCRVKLAGYKVPKHFVQVDELPRNASGKVLKFVLRERYREIGVPQA